MQIILDKEKFRLLGGNVPRSEETYQYKPLSISCYNYTTRGLPSAFERGNEVEIRETIEKVIHDHAGLWKELSKF